jgi:Protein of unknown function (DUF2975)
VRPETQLKLERVRRVSAGLHTACKVLLALVGILFAAASVGVLVGTGVTIRYLDLQIPVEPLTISARLILIAILALSMGIVAKGLHHLSRLFGNYASGEIFTTQSAYQIRQLGITAILWGCVNIVWLIADFSFAHSTGSIPLHLDSVLIGVIVIVISWFMQAAAEMREDNDLTI